MSPPLSIFVGLGIAPEPSVGIVWFGRQCLHGEFAWRAMLGAWQCTIADG